MLLGGCLISMGSFNKECGHFNSMKVSEIKRLTKQFKLKNIIKSSIEREKVRKQKERTDKAAKEIIKVVFGRRYN